jgi:hypothetical protein
MVRVSDTPGRSFAGLALDGVLDAVDDLLGIVLTAMDEQPRGALGTFLRTNRMPTGEHGAEREGKPPGQFLVAHDRGVEQRDGDERARHGPHPEGAVDGDVDATPILGRDQLVDRGVDRGVLPADAGTRDGRQAKYQVGFMENAVSTVPTR